MGGSFSGDLALTGRFTVTATNSRGGSSSVGGFWNKGKQLHASCCVPPPLHAQFPKERLQKTQRNFVAILFFFTVGCFQKLKLCTHIATLFGTFWPPLHILVCAKKWFSAYIFGGQKSIRFRVFFLHRLINMSCILPPTFFLHPFAWASSIRKSCCSIQNSHSPHHQHHK